MTEEVVVLVDTHDNQVGLAPKLLAHREGLLHRAISVFVFKSTGEMLLQRRAAQKYHSGGLWSNACCSHPRPHESPHRAAIRRLEEEIGLEVPLDYAFSFIYRATLDSGLTEHELDHVFTGVFDGEPRADPEEVDDWRWVDVEEIRDELASAPERFTAWFPLAFHELLARRQTTRRIDR